MMEMSAEATIAVMENLLKYGKYNIPTRNAMENAVRLLKDQPEIVRCRDCREFNFPEPDGTAMCCREGFYIDPDGFCSMAEKRKGESDS